MRFPGRVASDTTCASAYDLSQALRRAEAAHGQHEARTGQRDENWADWYAEYMVRERPGMSAFVLEDGVVYHTYSTYARGLDGLWGMYQWLDRAPQGRNETGVWWRRHDEYDKG